MTSRELSLYKKHGASALIAEADRQLAAKSARSRRLAPRKAPGREAKEAAKSERLARLAVIRLALHAESGGRCVICGGEVAFVRMHAHHVLGGSERRAEERQETMAPAHEKCHDVAHGKDGADPLPALRSLRSWCSVTDRIAAVRGLDRRIAKIEEARASSPTRTEVTR